MSTITLGQLETLASTRVLDHLDREASIPAVTVAACQGDVSVWRTDDTPAAATPLPQAGFPVVRGEAGGNTHSLHAAPGSGVCFTPAGPGTDELTLGTLTVPDGSEAYLLHPEHGGLAITPGTFRIGRQREWAGEWRLVAD